MAMVEVPGGSAIRRMEEQSPPPHNSRKARGSPRNRREASRIQKNKVPRVARPHGPVTLHQSLGVPVLAISMQTYMDKQRKLVFENFAKGGVKQEGRRVLELQRYQSEDAVNQVA